MPDAVENLRTLYFKQKIKFTGSQRPGVSLGTSALQPKMKQVGSCAKGEKVPKGAAMEERLTGPSTIHLHFLLKPVISGLKIVAIKLVRRG